MEDFFGDDFSSDYVPARGTSGNWSASTEVAPVIIPFETVRHNPADRWAKGCFEAKVVEKRMITTRNNKLMMKLTVIDLATDKKIPLKCGVTIWDPARYQVELGTSYRFLGFVIGKPFPETRSNEWAKFDMESNDRDPVSELAPSQLQNPSYGTQFMVKYRENFNSFARLLGSPPLDKTSFAGVLIYMGSMIATPTKKFEYRLDMVFAGNASAGNSTAGNISAAINVYVHYRRKNDSDSPTRAGTVRQTRPPKEPLLMIGDVVILPVGLLDYETKQLRIFCDGDDMDFLLVYSPLDQKSSTPRNCEIRAERKATEFPATMAKELGPLIKWSKNLPTSLLTDPLELSQSLVVLSSVNVIRNIVGGILQIKELNSKIASLKAAGDLKIPSTFKVSGYLKSVDTTAVCALYCPERGCMKPLLHELDEQNFPKSECRSGHVLSGALPLSIPTIHVELCDSLGAVGNRKPTSVFLKLSGDNIYKFLPQELIDDSAMNPFIGLSDSVKNQLLSQTFEPNAFVVVDVLVRLYAKQASRELGHSIEMRDIRKVVS